MRQPRSRKAAGASALGRHWWPRWWGRPGRGAAPGWAARGGPAPTCDGMGWRGIMNVPHTSCYLGARQPPCCRRHAPNSTPKGHPPHCPAATPHSLDGVLVLWLRQLLAAGQHGAPLRDQHQDEVEEGERGGEGADGEHAGGPDAQRRAPSPAQGRAARMVVRAFWGGVVHARMPEVLRLESNLGEGGICLALVQTSSCGLCPWGLNHPQHQASVWEAARVRPAAPPFSITAHQSWRAAAFDSLSVDSDRVTRFVWPLGDASACVRVTLLLATPPHFVPSPHTHAAHPPSSMPAPQLHTGRTPLRTNPVPVPNGGVWHTPPAARPHPLHSPPPSTWLRARCPRQCTCPTPTRNGGGGREVRRTGNGGP